MAAKSEPGMANGWAELDICVGKRVRGFRAVPNAQFRTAAEGCSAPWSARIWCAGRCWWRRASPRTPCSWCCMARSRCAKPAISLPIAELRAGELVGEIGFFANVPRTADVIAIRDTSVLVLTRAAYQELAEDTPAIVEAVLAALALRFARETARLTPMRASPKARTVALIEGGYEPVSGGVRSPHARGAGRDRCRDRRSRPRSRRCFPAGRWMRPKSPTGSTSSSRSRRWWSISAAAKLGLDAQGDPPGRHGGVRHAVADAPAAGADGDRNLRLQGSSGARRGAWFAFTTGAAAKSAAPRPGSRACPASCITMSRSRIRSISTA